jgi:hypothetical protein
MHYVMHEALLRERMQATEEYVRRARLRKLAVLRRRQRKGDAARRALQALTML